MAKSRPHVILSAAMSLDGKIATKNGDSKFSSKTDKIRVHKLRAKVDAILIGKNTVQLDNPLLTVRYTKGDNPLRIILDSKAMISSQSRIIKTCSIVPTLIVVSKNAPQKNLTRLKKYPVTIVVSGNHIIDVKKLLKILWKLKIKKILLEGGGTINWEFINKNLVDEMIITITPFLVGGIDAISLVQGNGFSEVSKSLKIYLKKIIRQGNELILHYTN